jgi:hypothetical protein
LARNEAPHYRTRRKAACSIARGSDHLVIASQRVRPEVAGPMTGSAKQSRVFRKWLWIASPFGLAMTKVRIYGDEEIKPRAVTTIH